MRTLAPMIGALGLATALAGCIDTSIPDLDSQLGSGPTDGPICSADFLLEDLPPETMRLHFIDVGQGDAIWVQTPYLTDLDFESKNVVIDFGPEGTADTLVDYLLLYGIEFDNGIDTAVVTHGDNDHYGGLQTVQDNLPVADVWSSEDIEQFEDPGIFGSFVDAQLLWSPSVASEHGVTEDNNRSVVFSVSWAGRRVLLMGDIEEEVEEILVDSVLVGDVQLEAAVLKVAHHGSASSSTKNFLDWVFPGDMPDGWAIITSGRKSFSGTTLPSAEVVDRLHDYVGDVRVLSTENRDEDKTESEAHGDDHVVVTIDADGTVHACYVY